MWHEILIFLLIVSTSTAWKPLRFHPSSRAFNDYEYETKYIETLVDHFSFVNDDHFQLKYLLSTAYFEKGGPIFFYTGNEGAIETFAKNTGFLWETAKNLSAAVVFAEHRYYGDSLPYANETFKNRSTYAYLTAEQALADYALLATSLLSEERFTGSPIVAFGGSYGGMLAAWFRMKYPNLVNGAIAASAPVWMFPNLTDCGTFFRTVTKTFEHDGGKQCKEAVRGSWKAIQTVADGPQGKDFLKDVFVLCDPLKDVNTLMNYLQDFLGTIAMVNYPYEASFIGTLPAFPVKVFCDKLTTDSMENADDPVKVVQLISLALRSLTNYTNHQTCVNLSAATQGLNTYAWYLQTCMEMTVPMCTDGTEDMFPQQVWDPAAFIDQCKTTFNVVPRMNWSTVQFWGKKLQTATNIVFSNGDLDPWSGLGVLTSTSAPLCTVIRIPNGAHHLDLRATNPLDPKDVIEARKKEVEMIKQWIAKS